jgi:hypothetical protein
MVRSTYQGRSYVMWSGSTDPDDLAIASRTLRILASTDPGKKKKCLTPVDRSGNLRRWTRPAAQREACKLQRGQRQAQ